MDSTEFRKQAHALVDWMADYLEQKERYPVRAAVQPREILDRLPQHPPRSGEPFEQIFADFQQDILPGITHWQHPSFFGYFPANSSEPSILGEMLTATLGAQCMSWVTSPAASELEERVMQWLREMIGLPEGFAGVIQDTASTATLCSILTAREVRSGYTINRRGFVPDVRYTVYCSMETHSSIEKAVKIAGIGSDYLRKIEVDADFALVPDALERSIQQDIRWGYTPLCAIATLGTTGSTAIDPLRAIGEVCKRHGVWLHVDAAFAGTALVLPEYRWLIDGIEFADTFVFNPHKWMMTNFDCTAYFAKDHGALVQTFEILPEYLKTPEGNRVNNYRDWGIQLGRRFRALKLWFVIRHFGVEGIQQRIRSHVQMAQELARTISHTPDFELLAPAPLNLLCFRYRPAAVTSIEESNALNARLMEQLNASGKLFLSHTKLKGAFAIRMVIGQTHVEQRHVNDAWNLIVTTARSLVL